MTDTAAFEEALAAVSEYNEDNPALAQLMRNVISRWVRTPEAHGRGTLATAIDALREGDADHEPARESVAGCIEGAIKSLEGYEWAGDIDQARDLLQAHLAWITR